MARGHPDVIIGALGYNQRATWFNNNVDNFFCDDGPLSACHFHDAQTLAQGLYNSGHSSDQTRTKHEDIPEWAQKFFILFEALQNQEANARRSSRVCDE